MNPIIFTTCHCCWLDTIVDDKRYMFCICTRDSDTGSLTQSFSNNKTLHKNKDSII